MNWLKMPTQTELIVIGIGLVFLLATIWEWRKGYQYVKGFFPTPFDWKTSLLLRIVFSVILILMTFVTAEESAVINRVLLYRIGFAIMIFIGIGSFMLRKKHRS